MDIADGFLPTPPGASVAARAGVHGLEGARAAGEGARVIGDSARLVGDGSHLTADGTHVGVEGLDHSAAEGAGRDARTEFGCSGFNSFSPDTLVATDKGERPISELKVGDKVLAYNEATGQNEYDTIEAVHINDDPETLTLTIDDERIETTPHHPFYTQDRGWTDAGALAIGEQVRKDDGTFGTVHAKLLHEATRRMYNLTVARAHTFFVGTKRWLVHNTNGCGELGDRSAQFGQMNDADIDFFQHYSKKYDCTFVVCGRRAETDIGLENRRLAYEEYGVEKDAPKYKVPAWRNTGPSRRTVGSPDELDFFYASNKQLPKKLFEKSGQSGILGI